MAAFVLRNNTFEFNRTAFQQKLGAAKETKLPPAYTYIYMGQVEQNFLEIQSKMSLIWLRCTHNIFFIWTNGEQKLKKILPQI